MFVSYYYYCLFASGLIGFDCGGHSFNITALSLLNICDCELIEVEIHIEETYVQLL